MAFVPPSSRRLFKSCLHTSILPTINYVCTAIFYNLCSLENNLRHDKRGREKVERGKGGVEVLCVKLVDII